jgi:hypothetical protein
MGQNFSKTVFSTSTFRLRAADTQVNICYESVRGEMTYSERHAVTLKWLPIVFMRQSHPITTYSYSYFKIRYGYSMTKDLLYLFFTHAKYLFLSLTFQNRQEAVDQSHGSVGIQPGIRSHSSAISIQSTEGVHHN